MKPTHSTVWNDLPNELILDIFDYLDFRMLKHISCVNQQWFQLSRHRIEERSIFRCDRLCLPSEGASQALRRYGSICMTDLSFGEMITFLKNIDPYGDVIKDISLHFTDMTNMTCAELFTMLDWSKKLSKLSLMLVEFPESSIAIDKSIAIDSLKLCAVLHLPPVFHCLTNLSVDATPISHDVTKQLLAINRTTLQKLEIDFNSLRNYQDLRDIQNLETLQLNNWNGHSRELFTKCPNLKHLDLPGNENLTDDTFAYIVESLPNLESLNLDECKELTDNGFALIQKLRNLKKLSIDSRQLFERGINRGFSQPMPNFEKLSIMHYYNGVTDKIFENLLKNTPNLTKLYIFALPSEFTTNLTIDLFQKIALSFKKLKHLTLNETMFDEFSTNNSVIPEFKSLEYLDLRFLVPNDSILHTFLIAPKLKILKIAVEKLSNDDARSIVDKFPLLEELQLKCPTLSDEIVDIFCQGLPRLRYLRTCYSFITTLSLKSVLIHCKELIDCSLNLEHWFSYKKCEDVNETLTEMAKLRSPEMRITYNNDGEYQNYASGLMNDLCEILINDEAHYYYM